MLNTTTNAYATIEQFFSVAKENNARYERRWTSLTSLSPVEFDDCI